MTISLGSPHPKLTVLLVFAMLFVNAGGAQSPPPVDFESVIEKRQTSENPTAGFTFEKFCPVATDELARRVLQSYGAIFVASDAVRLPTTCVFKGESDVLAFQKKLQRRQLEIKGARIDLQSAASIALEAALTEATTVGSSITPLDGAIAGGRSYGDTLMLWNSRVFPAIEFWIKRGRLPVEARDEIARLDLRNKILKILEWESQGIFFSTGRTRSILTSTAPPGTSQHLSLIAFDVTEYWNPDVRVALNRNGWFQTVIDDPPHFTYLGYAESELPSRGLIAIAKGGHVYWVPNMPSEISPMN